MSVAEEAMIGALLVTDPAPQVLNRITVPALAVLMEDDRFETAAVARHIVGSVKGAELILYPTGR